MYQRINAQIIELSAVKDTVWEMPAHVAHIVSIMITQRNVPTRSGRGRCPSVKEVLSYLPPEYSLEVTCKEVPRKPAPVQPSWIFVENARVQ
jgi:hypothetical protein